MRPVTCLDEADVLAFVSGQLDPDGRRRSEEHLDRCTDCLALIAAVAAGEGRARGAARDASAADRTAAGKMVHAAADPDAPAPRYEIGVEIARGGMGTVYTARDTVLDRHVAVKLLGRGPGPLADGSPGAGSAQLSPTLSADTVRRFGREVSLTARLQHPSIVPIYDAGVLPDGTPFYAMRMVAGQTLERAADQAASLNERLALLPSVLAAAEAVAYAHSEGVVHRDLKPQNVLIGPFGETVVLDWGLAKDLRRDPLRDPTDSGRMSSPDRGSSPDTTQVGEVVGTLAYMAPERMAGDPGSERGDVYGLGAMLYRVLAGGLPRRRAGDEPEPLALRQPGVPPELEAITARAIAPDPAARYASAAELADDLRRFQTGQLVAAHRYSRRELARRWIRRRRGALIAAGIAVTAIAVVTALSFERVVARSEEAEAARGRAEEERRAAEQLIGFLMGDLRQRLDAVGRLDALAATGRSIDAYFARVPVRAGAAGFEDLTRRGQALSIVGDAALTAGDVAAATRHYDSALAALREAALRRPGSQADDAICRTYMRQSDLAMARGDFDRARESAAACGALAAGHTADGDSWPFLAASAVAGQGRAALGDGEWADARRFLESAEAAVIALHRPGARAPDPEGRENLRAVVYDDLAAVGLETGDLPLALRAAGENRTALEAWRTAHPNDAEAEHRLGGAQLQLGSVQLTAGRIDVAIAELTAAQATCRRLVARDPANSTWRRQLGTALQRSADAELAAGRPQAALPLQQESRDISRALAAAGPDRLDVQRDLVVDELAVARIEQALGRLDAAAETARRAAGIAETLHSGARGAEDLSVVLLNQAGIDVDRHRPDDAAPVLARAIDLRRELLDASDTPYARHLLVSALLLQLELPAHLAGEPCALLAEAAETFAPIAKLAASEPDLASLAADLKREAAARPSCAAP